MLHRNRRLLLWWSQQKKDVNDVNLQFDNSQSGHGPPRGGAWPDWPPWIRQCPGTKVKVTMGQKVKIIVSKFARGQRSEGQMTMK